MSDLVDSNLLRIPKYCCTFDLNYFECIHANTITPEELSDTKVLTQLFIDRLQIEYFRSVESHVKKKVLNYKFLYIPIKTTRISNSRHSIF